MMPKFVKMREDRKLAEQRLTTVNEEFAEHTRSDKCELFSIKGSWPAHDWWNVGVPEDHLPLRMCKQCKKAPCIEACPLDAIHRDPRLRIPIIDTAKCNGCQACLEKGHP